MRETLLPAGSRPQSSYRTVLALDTGAVEAQGGDPVDGPLDVEDTLIASLARLRLRQVSSLKGDGLYFPHGYQDLLRGHQLGTILEEQAERFRLSCTQLPAPLSQGRGQGPRPGQTLLYPGGLPRRKTCLPQKACGISREDEIDFLAPSLDTIIPNSQVVLDLVCMLPLRN